MIPDEAVVERLIAGRRGATNPTDRDVREAVRRMHAADVSTSAIAKRIRRGHNAVARIIREVTG